MMTVRIEGSQWTVQEDSGRFRVTERRRRMTVRSEGGQRGERDVNCHVERSETSFASELKWDFPGERSFADAQDDSGRFRMTLIDQVTINVNRYIIAINNENDENRKV